MEGKMFKASSFFHSLPLAALLFLVVSTVHATLPHPLPRVGGKFHIPTFIVRTCRGLESPALCQKTLIPYAKTLKSDLGQAAAVVVNVDYLRAQRMFSYIQNISAQANLTKGSDPKVIEAANLCMFHYRSVIGQIQGSKDILDKRDGKYKEDLKDLMDDVDMNIALAISAAAQCEEAWKTVVDCPLKAELTRRTSKLLDFTSNARQIADAFAHTIKPPPEDDVPFVYAPINISEYGPNN